MNTSYQVGSALGLAVMTAVASAYGADQLGDPAALTDGYSAAFIGAAIVAAVGALATAVWFRRSTGSDQVRGAGEASTKVAA